MIKDKGGLLFGLLLFIGSGQYAIRMWSRGWVQVQMDWIPNFQLYWVSEPWMFGAYVGFQILISLVGLLMIIAAFMD